jgi:hypothetical protein
VDAAALAIIYSSSRWLVPSAPVRAGIVLIVAASAATHWEAAGNLANLHSFLLPAGVLGAMNPDAGESEVRATARAVLLVLACLSEALAPVIVAAYAVGMLLRRRGHGGWVRADLVAGVVVLAAGVTQAVTPVYAPRARAAGQMPGAATVLHDYWLWVWHWGWAGPTAGTTFGQAVLITVAFLLVAGVAVAVRNRRLHRTRVIAGLVLIAVSLGVFGLSVVVNRAVSPRYILAPLLLGTTGVAALLLGLYDRWRRPAGHVGTGLLAAALVSLAIIGPFRPNVSLKVPSWRSQMTDALYNCHAGDRGQQRIAVAPTGWGIGVTCATIRA